MGVRVQYTENLPSGTPGRDFTCWIDNVSVGRIKMIYQKHQFCSERACFEAQALLDILSMMHLCDEEFIEAGATIPSAAGFTTID